MFEQRIPSSTGLDPGRGVWSVIRTDFRRKLIYGLIVSLVAMFIAHVMVILLMGIAFWQTALLPCTVIPPVIAIPICFLAHHRRLVITMLNSKLRHALSHDQLTNAATRQVLIEEFPKARPPMAIAMIDADRFKVINDTHGHLVGDQVLRAIAATMISNVRTGDIVSRFGGEEFAILLADSDLDETVALCRRLKDHIASTPIQTKAGPIPITVSIGIAMIRTGERLEQALDRADAAVYRAKSEGRNCICVDETGPSRANTPAIDLAKSA